MKHICSIYFALLLTFCAQSVWGQKDSTARPVDTIRYKTAISDRISDEEDKDRGPSLSKMLKKANESYGKKHYFAAMNYYRSVLNSEPLHVEAMKGYGESALAIAALDTAEIAFQRMVDRGLSPSPDYFPKMRLAEVKFRKGFYDEAADLYDEVATLPQATPVPDQVKRRALEQKTLCLWATGDGLDNPYIIRDDTCFLLDTANVNTRELYSEYVANVQGDELYFSAYRFDLKKDRVNPKRNTIKLLKAKGAEGKVGPDAPMSVTESEFNDLKRQHTAHLSFNQAGDVVYYALGDYLRDSADIRFDLYRRKKLNGIWGAPEKLSINKSGFTSTEPSIGTLFNQSNETLFFVSDRPGGKGGRDIWFSNLNGDSLSTPKPLTKINTDGNDVTPFFHSPSSTLFYSTDSLRSLGGLDIYKSKSLPGGKWETPTHMGAPINSSANDAFFVLDKESQRAFFSSNRSGSMNSSEEGCCYDIFAVDFLKKYRAIALHDITKKPLPYTKITLYELDANNKLTPVAAPPADLGSSYTFNVRLNQKYAIIGHKAGFVPDTVYMTTPSELWTKEIVDTVYLRPLIYLVASVYDGDTGEPLTGATTTFFDLGAQDKKGTFVDSERPGKTDNLPETLNSIKYKLEYEHKYRVIATKEGYVSRISKADSSKVVSTIGLSEGDTIQVKLYLHKPSVLERYLPITLYFDNDFPKRIRATDPEVVNATDPYFVKMKADLTRNPKDPSYQDTILQDYQKTFISYMREKETYKLGVAEGLRGLERQNAIDTMEYFFEQEVRMNWDSFFSLSDQIDLMLQRGDTIILTLKGYASPLSNPEYNFHLTNRRIASVHNHFMIFDGGYFTKYREIYGTGQLKFIREANGDTESVKNKVNKDPSNRRLSVYDVKAARSRRVQIVGAKVSKGSKIIEKL